ncbi:MAG: NAD(P)-dependent oxidoreductase [Acidobacteriaceae bacterium]|nr:NAD(P)-dependent oxidoreductase [Acidobacteriaceae bacterium]
MNAIEDLETRLSEPTAADRDFMRELDGDVLILGAGGKMGPSLAKLTKRAADQAGTRKRVIAVSRFSSTGVRRDLEDAGVEVIACDLLCAEEVSRLPECQNVLYLAGRKFGSVGRPDLTWAANAIAPMLAASRYRRSRIVAFSTGNVYSFVEPACGGSRETDPPSPVGEYAQSCLARERVFEYFSNEHGTKCLLLRLNYATDLRYGVLVDIAQNVYAGEPLDLTVPQFNTIWQRDVNSYALRSLALCASPPRILNVTGAEMITVREAAQFFSDRFERPFQVRHEEGARALLSDSSMCHSLLGPPKVPFSVLREWVADWVSSGGETLNKPTHFEVTDGGF